MSSGIHMKMRSRIIAEVLFLFLFTFVLWLGHVVVANVYDVQGLGWSFVVLYCFGCLALHCALGLRKVPYGIVFTVLMCLATLMATKSILNKNEKGCRDWVVALIHRLQNVSGARK